MTNGRTLTQWSLIDHPTHSFCIKRGNVCSDWKGICLLGLFSCMINLNRVDEILVETFAESLCEIQRGIAFWIFRTANATWWYIFLIGHAVLQSEVEQNFRFGWLNQKLFREMKFYVFPRKWNDIYFSISMKDSSSRKSSQIHTKLNRETQKKSIRSRWTNKCVCLLFKELWSF